MNIISAQDLWDKKHEKSFIFLDVREADEIARAPYQGLSDVLTIPMNNVPSNLSLLDIKKDIIVGCRSGKRSAAICALLDEHNFNTYNLEGGILAWSTISQNYR